MEEQYPLWLEVCWFSATKTNFEKLPAGGGACGWIRNILESERLCFHCRPINWGKGGELVKVYTITYFKDYFIRNENKFRKTAGGRWSVWMNPEYFRIGTSLFSMATEKSRKVFPSSRSYWLPLQKFPTIAFHWYFIASFFVYMSLTSSANRKTKKLPVGKKCQSSFILRNGRSKLQEQTIWWHHSRKIARHFYVLYRSKLKNALDSVQYYGIRVFYSN